MNKADANRCAHGMVYCMILNLISDPVREDLPQADLDRIDAALDKWAQWHFRRSNLAKAEPPDEPARPA